MSKTQYTRGPWHRNIKPARKYNVIFAGRNTHVASLSTSGLTPEEIEANCDLIKAAPQLYESLQLLLGLVEVAGWKDQPALQRAQAALDYAEGK